jgi:hypothetical protein
LAIQRPNATAALTETGVMYICIHGRSAQEPTNRGVRCGVGSLSRKRHTAPVGWTTAERKDNGKQTQGTPEGAYTDERRKQAGNGEAGGALASALAERPARGQAHLTSRGATKTPTSTRGARCWLQSRPGSARTRDEERASAVILRQLAAGVRPRRRNADRICRRAASPHAARCARAVLADLSTQHTATNAVIYCIDAVISCCL